MVTVKGPRPPDPEPPGYQARLAPPLKKLWSAQRRKITPKIGQLTDDEREIARIVSIGLSLLSAKVNSRTPFCPDGRDQGNRRSNSQHAQTR